MIRVDVEDIQFPLLDGHFAFHKIPEILHYKTISVDNRKKIISPRPQITQR